MDDELSELRILQTKSIELHTAAIHTARHRPESASVVGRWAHEADLELLRFCKLNTPRVTAPPPVTATPDDNEPHL